MGYLDDVGNFSEAVAGFTDTLRGNREEEEAKRFKAVAWQIAQMPNPTAQDIEAIARENEIAEDKMFEIAHVVQAWQQDQANSQRSQDPMAEKQWIDSETGHSMSGMFPRSEIETAEPWVTKRQKPDSASEQFQQEKLNSLRRFQSGKGSEVDKQLLGIGDRPQQKPDSPLSIQKFIYEQATDNYKREMGRLQRQQDTLREAGNEYLPINSASVWQQAQKQAQKASQPLLPPAAPPRHPRVPTGQAGDSAPPLKTQPGVKPPPLKPGTKGEKIQRLGQAMNVIGEDATNNPKIQRLAEILGEEFKDSPFHLKALQKMLAPKTSKQNKGGKPYLNATGNLVVEDSSDPSGTRMVKQAPRLNIKMRGGSSAPDDFTQKERKLLPRQGWSVPNPHLIEYFRSLQEQGVDYKGHPRYKALQKALAKEKAWRKKNDAAISEILERRGEKDAS